MARYISRRELRFENLESRRLLSGTGPTNEEQYMLQLINEARTDPSAAAAQISSPSALTPDVTATLAYYNVNLQQTVQALSSATPQPPLAWNSDLASSAQSQSQYEANTQTQTHTGSGGSTTEQRMQAAGYSNILSSGENTFAYASSAFESMQAFLIDWGVPSLGHRDNLLQPGVSASDSYRDVGIGIAQTNSSNSSFGPEVITQDFGSQTNEQAQIVGVAYNDTQGTNFYAPGEGQGNVQIDAVNTVTGQVSSTQTWSSGGYELSLAPGKYQLIASSNNVVIKSEFVTVGSENIEEDFIMTDQWAGGSRSAAIAAAQPAPVSVPTQQTPTPAPTIGAIVFKAAQVQNSIAMGTLTPNTTPTNPVAVVSGWSSWVDDAN
jgi:uncharacterized protein YkwD